MIKLLLLLINTVAGKLINVVSGFENIYQIINYALSSAHEKFGVSIKAVPKSKFSRSLRTQTYFRRSFEKLSTASESGLTLKT